jgi:hypothetical protein
MIFTTYGYGDAIMHKTARGKPLAYFQHLMNRIISAFRYRVEQDMGTLNKNYGFYPHALSLPHQGQHGIPLECYSLQPEKGSEDDRDIKEICSNSGGIMQKERIKILYDKNEALNVRPQGMKT